MSVSKPQNTTLKDVAKAVGVSAMTVSRVLSGKSHLVNAETVRKCREAAERLGYVPNLMARSLRGEQLRTIVMFAEYIASHHYLAELVEQTFRAIEQRGHSVIVCQSVSSFRQALKNFKLAGAVILAPPEEIFESPSGHGGRIMREPTVVIHSAVEQNKLNEVSPNIPGLARTQALHLLELGHRQIGYLGGPRVETEPLWFELRRKGIEEALAKYRLPPTACRHQVCPDADLAAVSLQQLMAKAPGTTGLICLSDEIAVAAMHGAEKMGLAVPSKLSVVGSNNINLAGFFKPTLTTMKIDIRSLVETALNLLFEEIKGGAASGQPVKIKIESELIVRESTAPPPTSPGL